MRYYIPTVGYINDSQQFSLNEKTYPGGWLKRVNDAARNQIGAVARPTPGQYFDVTEGVNGWIVTDWTNEQIDAFKQSVKDNKIAQAWAKCDALALTGADHNSREKYLIWLRDPASSPERVARIEAVNAWMDAIWLVYGAFLAAIAADESAEMGEFPDATCPWNFWQIAGV